MGWGPDGKSRLDRCEITGFALRSIGGGTAPQWMRDFPGAIEAVGFNVLPKSRSRHTRKRLRRAFSAYALPRAMPHVPVNEEPGSSRIRASMVRNAFGGQVIGSTARLRRLTLGSGSPLKSIKYG